jgi:type II secretory pathway component PulC
MPKLAREYLLAAILAGLVLVLAVLLAVEWVVLDRDREAALAVPQVKATPSVNTESGDASDLELPPLEDYAQMADRPLFMESRRPGAEPSEAPPPPPPMTPLNLKLMGIVFTPQGKKALLVDAKGKYKRLKAQDSLDGWTLIEMKADQVVMQQGEERKSLDLLKKKPKAPPGPPGAQPPGPGPRPGMPGPQQRPMPPQAQQYQPQPEPEEEVPEEEVPEEEIPEEETDMGDQ